jgi:hypothetical protein
MYGIISNAVNKTPHVSYSKSHSLTSQLIDGNGEHKDEIPNPKELSKPTLIRKSPT